MVSASGDDATSPTLPPDAPTAAEISSVAAVATATSAFSPSFDGGLIVVDPHAESPASSPRSGSFFNRCDDRDGIGTSTYMNMNMNTDR